MEIDIKGYKVLIDDEDASKMGAYSWFVRKSRKGQSPTVYIYGDRCTNNIKDRVSLHRYLMGCIKGDGTSVDHINHNTLDNRKENLRVCTAQENNYNAHAHRDASSGHKGIRRRDNKWEVRLSVEKRSLSIGYVSSLQEAIELRDIASLYYHKEFACTEYPKEQYAHITDLKAEIDKRTFREYTSKYRGVTHRQNDGDYYQATIQSKGKSIFIGCFKNEDDAARAYNEHAIRLHGDRAVLNEVPNV